MYPTMTTSTLQRPHTRAGALAFTLVRLAAFAGVALLFAAPAARAAIDCIPAVEGPIPVGADEPTYRAISAAPLPDGYVDEEFFVSCTALGMSYKTLINVRRPEHRSKFSGDVVVEPVHPSNLWLVTTTTVDYWSGAGHAAVVVASSRFVLNTFVKPANAARYASLVIPATAGIEREILAQLGALLKTDSAAGPLSGMRVRHAVLGGYSNTGAVLRDYIFNTHDQARLANGRSVYDGYFPGQTAVGSAPTPLPDLDVPIVEIMGESEVIRTFQRGATELGYRRADGPLYRLYEVAGQSHITSRPPNALAVPYICIEPVRSMFPLQHLWNMALRNLVLWVDFGIPAPHAPRIELAADGRTVVRDAFGNAVGGVRSSYLDVPIATYFPVSTNAPTTPPGSRCDFLGFQTAFTPEQLVALYGSHGRYVEAVVHSLQELIRQGFYRPEDAREILLEAAKADVP